MVLLTQIALAIAIYGFMTNMVNNLRLVFTGGRSFGIKILDLTMVLIVGLLTVCLIGLIR